MLINVTIVVGFPKMVAFDSLGKYNVLVMTKLGPSLEDLFDGCKRKFTLKTVCQIGIQMVGSWLDVISVFYQTFLPWFGYLLPISRLDGFKSIALTY